jgi:hypothetical protein
MVGKKAVDAGLADRIGSFEATLKEMADGKGKRKKRMHSVAAETDNTLPESGDHSGGENMSEKSEDKGFFARLFAGLSPKEKEEVLATIDDAGNKTSSHHQQQPQGESEEVKQMKAENARLRAENKTVKKEKIEQAADGFVKSQILARTMLPAEAESFKAAYIQAATDDSASPLADGGTRVKLLEAGFEKRPKHNLSMELVKTQLKGAQALDDQDDPEAAELEQARVSALKFAERANGKKAS